MLLNWFLTRRKLNTLKKVINSNASNLLKLDELINNPIEEGETAKERNIKILDTLNCLKEDIVLSKVHVSNIDKV
ncbi:hypothetical protein SBF1_4030001 [Candidatus Desulfosporosinus infrequens]|uniref:Uncharacterized protein n=1 Tax=Candidatus Desulfosporosinus infrequens TaxID=2043169 RepID=A0A2U3L8E1_9FIRM|nr:hypothetical protein SBF1_4030001 [Candidatus Desulfosporosinus infrequens]